MSCILCFILTNGNKKKHYGATASPTHFPYAPDTGHVPLRSNCHPMIHCIGGQGDCMTVEQLRDLLIEG